MAARAYLGAPTVRTPTDNGTPVEDLNTSTARNPLSLEGNWPEEDIPKRTAFSFRTSLRDGCKKNLQRKRLQQDLQLQAQGRKEPGPRRYKLFKLWNLILLSWNPLLTSLVCLANLTSKLELYFFQVIFI